MDYQKAIKIAEFNPTRSIAFNAERAKGKLERLQPGSPLRYITAYNTIIKHANKNKAAPLDQIASLQKQINDSLKTLQSITDDFFYLDPDNIESNKVLEIEEAQIQLATIINTFKSNS